MFGRLWACGGVQVHAYTRGGAGYLGRCVCGVSGCLGEYLGAWGGCLSVWGVVRMCGQVSRSLRVSSYLGGCLDVWGCSGVCGCPGVWRVSGCLGGVRVFRGVWGSCIIFSPLTLISLSPLFAHQTEKHVPNSPMTMVEGSTMMKAGGSAPNLGSRVQPLSWAKRWPWGPGGTRAKSDAYAPSTGAVVMG